MKNKIDCGFGITITPATRTEMGLDYSDYKIENSMENKNETN